MDFSEPSEECLSCVNRSYHIPFRLHRNTRNRTSIMQCLVNSRKYTSRRNPSIGRTPLYSSTAARALPSQNPYTKCMSQYSTWENTKGMLATCLPTIHNAAVTCTAFILKEVHVQFNGYNELTCSNMTPHSRTEMDKIVS